MQAVVGRNNIVISAGSPTGVTVLRRASCLMRGSGASYDPAAEALHRKPWHWTARPVRDVVPIRLSCTTDDHITFCDNA